MMHKQGGEGRGGGAEEGEEGAGVVQQGVMKRYCKICMLKVCSESFENQIMNIYK